MLAAARYALSGIVVGAASAAAIDFVFDTAVSNLAPASSDPNPASNTGKGLFVLVVGACAVGAGALGGDKVMDWINSGVEDPLYHGVFYNITLTQSRAANLTAMMVRQYIVNTGRMVGSSSSSYDPAAPTSSPPASGATCSTCPLAK